MRSLVIGGAGFIGSHLCDALLAAGDLVICVDNFSLGTKKNICHLMDNRQFRLYETDAADRLALRQVFQEAKPDYVFHLAANSDIQASAQNPEVEYRNTYTTTYHTLECMREYGVKHLFFASTSAVYGDQRDVCLREDTPGLAPVSYYGAAKLGSEALISAYSYMNDFNGLIFRFPNVIGPRLTHGVIFDFMRKLKTDPSRLIILGDGKQTKPYIYVEDLVRAVMQLKDGSTDSVSLYNVGVSGETSVTKIADLLCEELRLSGVSYEYTGGEGGWKGDVPRFRYCLDKIHATGWKAVYLSDEAVRKTIQMLIKDYDK